MGQRLGQHFLKNKLVIQKIINALNLERGDVVIEIGPGKGALTIPLGERCREVGCGVVAIEKDVLLAQKLREATRILCSHTNNANKIKIISGDALQELPRVIARSELATRQSHQHDEIASPGNTGLAMTPRIKLVGNIPYYITGALLRVISELPYRPVTTVLMVQKEVAERVASQPPKMNLLAAATQIWADVSIIARLKPNDFDPPPEVSSAVILLDDRRSMIDETTLNIYYRFIHRAFKQPRKTLLNNMLAKKQELMKTLNQKDQNKNAILSILQSLGYTEKTRAQSLCIDELIKLSNQFCDLR